MSLKSLINVSTKSRRRILGLMSGTSLDGVDLALVTLTHSGIETEWELEQFTTVPYPTRFAQHIREQMIPETSSVDRICGLNIELGQYLAHCILETLDAWCVDPSEVDCIGSHGQTLYHLPNGNDWEGNPLASTFQIGDGDQIAGITGILTISEFRNKDIALGGEGAPLLPYVDFLLFNKPGTTRVLHNLGGISNLTLLPKSGNSQDVLAFDTGPANVLINLAVEALIDPNRNFDLDGTIAKGRNVS